MKHAIIIPCYNEAKRLDLPRFGRFVDSASDYLVCFVNDGSTDNTLDVLQAFKKEHPDNVAVYDMPQNGGKAEAVRNGVLYVLDHYPVETVGYLDADLATDFEDYGQLIAQLDKNNNLQCAFGSRKLNTDNDIERSTFRKMASKIVYMMILMIIRIPVKDTQCGAKAFKRSIAWRIFKEPFHSRWLFDIELFIRMKSLYSNSIMRKIKEIALKRWVEVEGSKITLKDSLEMPMRLCKIAYEYDIAPRLAYMESAITAPVRLLSGGLAVK